MPVRFPTPLAWAARHRGRLTPLIAVVGIAVVGLQLWSAAPREGTIEYLLGDRHAQLVEVRIAYLSDGQEQQTARFAFPEGAPSRLTHRVRLPVGQLEAVLELHARSGAVRRVRRSLASPFEGTLRLRIDDAPRAEPPRPARQRPRAGPLAGPP